MLAVFFMNAKVAKPFTNQIKVIVAFTVLLRRLNVRQYK
jgi:hypothetical protein